MHKVVTLTLNPTVDKNARVDQVVPEHKLRCYDVTYEPGGGGLNVSRALLNLGRESLAVYTQGGPNGELLTRLLKNEGLEGMAIPIAGWTRVNLIVYEDSSGQQFRFGMPGPRFTKSETQRVIDKIATLDPLPEYLVISGSLPPGVEGPMLGQLARRMKDRGVKVIYDSSGAGLEEAIKEGVFLIKPNLRELSLLTGKELTDDRAQIEAARGLIREGAAEVVLVSLGGGGGLLVYDSGHEFMRSPTVPIRSKVGAGDSMVGGVTSALLAGKSIREAARYGIAAGAAAVMTPGTQLCSKEDTDRLYEIVVHESAQDYRNTITTG